MVTHIYIRHIRHPIKHSDEVLKTTMKVAEIFARMVGNDHKMAHSIANDL